MSTARGSLLLSIVRNRELIVEMAARDMKGAGKGALLGHAWLVINPLLQTAAFVVIVSYVFRVRLPGSGDPLDYALYVLSGMVPWHIMTRSLQESTSLIRDRMELVKQVIYPIETLPLTSILVNSLASMVILGLFLALGAIAGTLQPTVLLLPLPLALLVLLLLGASWVLSIVGVLLRDLREIVSIVFALLVFVSPVVLHEAMVVERLWSVVMWNPLAHVVVCFRDVFQGELHPHSWAIFAALTALALAAGAWVMLRAKVLINEYI
jgi:lipopolysaccharide transport system permease protein